MPETGEDRVKLQSLELGRFIAALLVMLSHASPYVNTHAASAARPMFGGMLFSGPLGVQYFFVLSGFVMMSVHYHDFGKFSAVPWFWWRRACRIYPVYWLALSIPVFYYHHSLTPMLFLHQLLLDPWNDVGFIPATWSMRYEVAFYIMFGLCLLPYVGKPLLAFWVFLDVWSWILGFHIHFGGRPLGLMVHFALSREIDFFSFFEYYFFAGLAAGFVFARYRFGWRVWAGFLAAGALALCRVLPMEQWGVIYGSGPVFTLTTAVVLAVAMLGLAGLERLGVFRLGRLAGWLGAMSYPLYIVHEPVLLIITHELQWGGFGTAALYAHFAVLLLIIFVAAALLTFLFDQPVQRGLRRLTRRMRAA